MSATFKLVSTLVVCLFVCTISFSQSASVSPTKAVKKVKVKKSKKALTKYYEAIDKATANENYVYNTDIYDAISPGFSTEVPATKTRIYRLEEDSSTAYSKKTKSTKNKDW